MKVLHETPQSQLRARLAPLVEAYRDWIDREKARIDDPAEDLERFRSAASAAIERCEATLRRIEEGLDLVATDRQVADAVRFMNQSMWLQRTRSLFSEGVRRGKDIDYNDVDIERNRSWYPFQLAFILLNLPGLAWRGSITPTGPRAPRPSPTIRPPARRPQKTGKTLTCDVARDNRVRPTQDQ